MSNQPPPYLSGPQPEPGHQPSPHGGALPPPASPGSPTGGPPAGTGGLTFDTRGKPSPTKGGSKLGLIIAAAAAVVAIVVIAVVATGGGGGGGIDAAGAAAGFEAVFDDADFTDGTADLRRCPLGDTDELAASVQRSIDIDDEVVDGDSVANAVQGDVVDYVECSVTAADGVRGISAVYFGANSLPRGDYSDYLNVDIYGGDRDIEVEDPEAYRGGQLYAYCVAENDEFIGVCGADWVHEASEIALYIYLDDSDDPAEAVTALKAVLGAIASGLAGQAS